jgi:hypothetical protein
MFSDREKHGDDTGLKGSSRGNIFSKTYKWMVRESEKEQKKGLGRLFIDPKTGKPDKALASCVIIGLLAGGAVCEWYCVANGWPKIGRIAHLFGVTWGFAIGGYAGAAIGYIGYKVFKRGRAEENNGS